jgi:hypothetical protein
VTSQVVSIAERLTAPAWAFRLAGGRPGNVPETGPGESVETLSGAEFALTCGRVAGAGAMEPGEFGARVRELYDALAEAVERLPAANAVRFWNFLPDIHAPAGDGLDRYMIFNRARFDAYSARFGGPESFPSRLPTASAVGHAGADFSAFCLSSVHAGVPVENPRQRPAWRYSRRFGPRPPCFSRATIVPSGGGRLLLAAGTSSVRGEESMHAGDLDGQIEETVENLTALSPRGNYRELRIYCTQERYFERCRAAVAQQFPGVERIEPAVAELCRRELLVEIEGLAVLE